MIFRIKFSYCSFRNYFSFIPSTDPPNHSVLAIGWGTLNGVDYWLIKNSWGAGWGENGYTKVKRGTCNTNYGCTVLTAVESTICSKDSPCGRGKGHCESDDTCQSGLSCESKSCPAIETCEDCPHYLLPDANCCEYLESEILFTL